jgi:arylsulfatase A
MHDKTPSVQTSLLSRRGFLSAAGLAAVTAGCASMSGRPGGRRTAPPNVVFILVDDLGWADLGCQGNTHIDTPNIDRLAAQGMRFTDAYAACPVCSPTRASILSGQYPAHLGITDFIPGHWRPFAPLTVPVNRTQYLPHQVVTLPEALKDAGYISAHFGKWHLGPRAYFPDTQGFDEGYVSEGWTHFGNMTIPDQGLSKDDYLSEVLTEDAISFMRRQKNTGPFFVSICHFGVHIPLEAREELVAKYEAKPQPEGGYIHPVYAAMVEHIDQSVGRVMESLDEMGIADNTMLVFYSDNGGLIKRYDGAGETVTTNAPLRGEKGSLHEGGIRVPLVVRWPGRVPAGAECGVPVTSTDFYPTFLDAAGLTPPSGHDLDGVSLLPHLTGNTPAETPAIYWHYPHYHHSVPASAVREGDWKLIEFFEREENRLVSRFELYNLREDIGETRNLADSLPEVTGRLHQMLEDWRWSVRAQMPRLNPDHDPERAGEWAPTPFA